MKKITVERFYSSDKGTLSFIKSEGELLFFGLEREWLNNEPFISCVPSGVYKLEPYHSSKFGNVFIMSNPELNVFKYKQSDREKGRYACLIHPANYTRQLNGCLAIGSSITKENSDNLMITQSKRSVRELFDLIRSNGIEEIEFKWVTPRFDIAYEKAEID